MRLGTKNRPSGAQKLVGKAVASQMSHPKQPDKRQDKEEEAQRVVEAQKKGN